MARTPESLRLSQQFLNFGLNPAKNLREIATDVKDRLSTTVPSQAARINAVLDGLIKTVGGRLDALNDPGRAALLTAEDIDVAAEIIRANTQLTRYTTLRAAAKTTRALLDAVCDDVLANETVPPTIDPRP